MSLFFISIQGSYHDFKVVVFDDKKIIDASTKITQKASSALILNVDSILKKNNLMLDDIKFITIDQGPGAFTSLRTIITIANSISFARDIPLVGVDGLEALAQETIDSISKENLSKNPTLLISILNAYNKEVYFAIHPIEETSEGKLQLKVAIAKNYNKLDLLLHELSENYSKEIILFTGNGVSLYKKEIQEILLNQAIFLSTLVELSSAEQIGKMGLEQWNRQENIQKSLSPLYLKSQKFATRKK
jgi:tRNA threonylcarbamoyladenosine biosynthesis protein TsaB